MSPCSGLRLTAAPMFTNSDEDMQSLASLMSVKPADVGNLDDFNESDEEEDRKSVSGTGRRENAPPSGRSAAVLSFPLLPPLPPLDFFCSSSHSHSPKPPRPPAA